MHFSPFNATITNIFPASNTTHGGQLCTEFNLRSVDSVSIDPEITYFLSHSFVHSEHEFDLTYDINKGNSVLTILPGRSVINGHYFELLAPIDIDLAEGNAQEVTNAGVAVDGELCVGLKMMYSTNTTLVGDLDLDGNYRGIQVIVLPKREFSVPNDPRFAATKTDPNSFSAHLKLGEVIYDGRTIMASSIKQNLEKTRYFDPRRIKNIDSELGGTYFSKFGLVKNRMYTVSAKYDSSGAILGEFCDSTDSLFRWDNKCETFSSRPDKDLQALLRLHPTAAFLRSVDDQRVYLHLPHKQPENDNLSVSKSTDYRPVALDLPIADLSSGKAGVVNSKYSKQVNMILNKINEFYNLPNSKQLAFYESLADRKDLPKIPRRATYGDYIIYLEDTTLGEGGEISESVYSWPSTMYIVLPGIVNTLSAPVLLSTSSASPSGMMIAQTESSEPPSNDPNIYNKDYWDFDTMEFRGIPGQDYFLYVHKYTNEEGYEVSDRYYFSVDTCKNSEYGRQMDWSEPIVITGQIPLATEELVGGFLNVPEDSDHLDDGYVYLDGDGHLRLLDYSLLRSGLLAYQLGADQEFTGMDYESIQVELDERVNERIAFPNLKSTTGNSNIINITIELPDEESENVIEIRGIDSRFNTVVFVHLLGTPRNSTKIRFIDIEKLMIDNTFGGEPTLELYRCNLYYDAYIINKMSTIKNMTLWYEKFSDDDADILVDGMTVREIGAAIPVEEVDYWAKDNLNNDIHYQYALQSITFDNDGWVVGLGVYIRDKTTRNNVPTGRTVITTHFTLPHGSRLLYPPTRFNRPIKVSGNFVSAYIPSEMRSFKVYVSNIYFSAVTEPYDHIRSLTNIGGRMSFLDDGFEITAIGGDDVLVDGNKGTLGGIDNDQFHIFSGGVVG